MKPDIIILLAVAVALFGLPLWMRLFERIRKPRAHSPEDGTPSGPERLGRMPQQKHNGHD